MAESWGRAATYSTNHHKVAGGTLTYTDPLLEDRCLNIQIYCPEYNVFQEILSGRTHTQVHFLGQRTRVILIPAPKKKKR